MACTATGGTLSEPAGLAGFSLIAINYMVSWARLVFGWRRAGALTLAGVALWLGAVSTSAIFVVAGVTVAVITALTFLHGFLLRRTAVGAVVNVVCCALVIIGLWVLPTVPDFVEATVNEKVSSSSFSERSGVHSLAYDILINTFGVGVGLGATRASSFLPGLLATSVVGTLLFTAAIGGLIHPSAPIPEYRPVIWTLVTLLVAKAVAGPDHSDSSGVHWMSLGLLSRAALLTGQRPPPPRSASAVSASALTVELHRIPSR